MPRKRLARPPAGQRLARCMIAVALAAVPAAAAAEGLDGRWAMEGTRTVFRLQSCGAASCGVLEQSAHILADADARDANNHDRALRQRRLKGLQVFDDLQPARPGVWKGRIYVPGAGATYGVTLTAKGSETLVAKGCAAPLLCQSSVLKRLP